MADKWNEEDLVRVIEGSIGDDYYLDRDEEKGIKEEATANGMRMGEIERILLRELNKSGSACERLLLDELEQLLHQYTDQDRYLDGKEERDALDKVLIAAEGKRKGLDPRVATEFVDEFCRAHGVKRKGYRTKVVTVVAAAVLILGVAGVVLYNQLNAKPEIITKREIVKDVQIVEVEKESRQVPLSQEETTRIDQLIEQAKKYIEAEAFTDPPEACAKAALEGIKNLDPQKQYRVDETRVLVDSIIDSYISKAERDFNLGKVELARKWLDRAGLFNKNSETIRDAKKKYGFIEAVQ